MGIVYLVVLVALVGIGTIVAIGAIGELEVTTGSSVLLACSLLQWEVTEGAEKGKQERGRVNITILQYYIKMCVQVVENRSGMNS